MVMQLDNPPLPLEVDASGRVRMLGSRVGLELIVQAFKEGASAEDVVRTFPTLSLGDVYAVIAFYLRNQASVDAYVTEQESVTREVRSKIASKPDMQQVRETLLRRARS